MLTCNSVGGDILSPSKLGPKNVEGCFLNPIRAHSRLPEQIRELIVSRMCTQNEGFCVIDDLHDAAFADSVAEEVVLLHRSGLLQDGMLLRNNGSKNSTKMVRGDKTFWVTDNQKDELPAVTLHMSVLDRIIQASNGHLWRHVIRGRSPAMIACYPGNGACYLRHVDNPHSDGRCITALYYLNKNWDGLKNGGQLRIYPNGGRYYFDIDPLFNRLVLFWSDWRTPHEVLPSYANRYAITMWYFDAKEREQYCSKATKISP